MKENIILQKTNDVFQNLKMTRRF